MNINTVPEDQEWGIDTMTTFGRDFKGPQGRAKAIRARQLSYQDFLANPDSIPHRTQEEMQLDIDYATAALRYLKEISR